MLNEILQEAEKKLKENRKNYDAFLVYGIARLLKLHGEEKQEAERATSKIDLVPESTVDENITTMQDHFVEYMRQKRAYRAGNLASDELTAALNKTLRNSRKIVSEIYASCDTIEEQMAVKSFVNSLEKIVQ